MVRNVGCDWIHMAQEGEYCTFLNMAMNFRLEKQGPAPRSSLKYLIKSTYPEVKYCDMHACLRPLLSNGPRSTVNSGNAC
jgi:hypothetical protein